VRQAVPILRTASVVCYAGGMGTTSNNRPPSTTWRWETRRVRVPPEATRAASPEATRLSRLYARDRRKPLQVTITYRGGAECWWELRARGKVVRQPGAMALHDVLSLFDGTLRKKPGN